MPRLPSYRSCRRALYAAERQVGALHRRLDRPQVSRTGLPRRSDRTKTPRSWVASGTQITDRRVPAGCCWAWHPAVPQVVRRRRTAWWWSTGRGPNRRPRTGELLCLLQNVTPSATGPTIPGFCDHLPVETGKWSQKRVGRQRGLCRGRDPRPEGTATYAALIRSTASSTQVQSASIAASRSDCDGKVGAMRMFVSSGSSP